MSIQQRLITFITRTNWVLFWLVTLVGLPLASPAFTRGIIAGGLIVTINFHLLALTLRKAFTPPHLASTGSILAKYYVRFAVSGVIIFILIAGKLVHPLGLFVGLSVVVASILLATVLEVKNLFFKEAV